MFDIGFIVIATVRIINITKTLSCDISYLYLHNEDYK